MEREWRMNLYVLCRGLNYSPINSDYSINLKYITFLLYTIYLILYILL